MNKGSILAILIAATTILASSVFCQAIIIDHNCTDLSKIPETYLNSARGLFRISYGHTSHGSQIVTGMNNIYNWYGATYAYSYSGGEGALSFHDYEPDGDLGNPNRTAWDGRTRALLDTPGNDRNMIMWSWCGQVSSATQSDIANDYLARMHQLESDYPSVKFIYMTGHLDIWSYDNLTARNQQIRDYCNANGKVLFDFADIESYNPSGTHYQYADDECNYYSDSTGSTQLGNWAIQWCSSHSGDPLCDGDNSCIGCGCAHSVYLNCNLKGRAFWWMLARLAGWGGSSSTTPTPVSPGPTPVSSPSNGYSIDSGDYNGDGTSDIAIFRPGSGLWSVRGMTRVYFGGLSDYPVSGDYDGDDTTDIGLFRPSSGLWVIRRVSRVYFGSSSDSPVPGDYNGDGDTDMGIFRSASGLWAIRDITRAYFGSSSDTPIPGDYTGNGASDIGLFRSASGLWAIRGFTRYYFGDADDVPIPGDYNGWGFRHGAIYRPSSGLWAFHDWEARYYFGGSGDQAVPGNYTGDSGGIDNIGIFRAASGLWAIHGITRAYFGTSGDIPVVR